MRRLLLSLVLSVGCACEHKRTDTLSLDCWVTERVNPLYVVIKPVTITWATCLDCQVEVARCECRRSKTYAWYQIGATRQEIAEITSQADAAIKDSSAWVGRGGYIAPSETGSR